MRLTGRVAIVTGAGRGIGRGIARRFAAEGAAVLLTSRTAAELEEAASEITESGGRAATVTADVSRETECERVVGETRDRFGAVDILVNNAGIFGPVRPAEEITPAEFDEVIAINLRGPFLLSRLVLPEMYERGAGVILNIASIGAKLAFPWNGAYGTSKAGIIGLTRTIAAEAARRGVRVNAICPGPVTETRMSQELGRAIGERLGLDEEAQREGFLESVLQGRAQTVDEIAAAALFLASDEGSAITAQAINVDGGMVYY
jgi:NAD(P)-dependent dehydrogenase (short-subunit alcohol dehydrogenase family)